jgi:hypothetical protein
MVSCVHCMPLSGRTTNPYPGKRCSEVHPIFGIVELLENVLLHVSREEVVKCQQVCKQWNDTIQKSTRIQVALYLRSINANPASELRGGGHLLNSSATHNHINVYTHDDINTETKLMKGLSVEGIFTVLKLKEAAGLVCSNPLVRSLFSLGMITNGGFYIGCYSVDLPQIRVSKRPLLGRALLTQPPIKQVELEVIVYFDGVGASWDSHLGDRIWLPQFHEASLGWTVEHSREKRGALVVSNKVSHSNPDGLTIADLVQVLKLTTCPLYDDISLRANDQELPAALAFKIVSAS